MARRPKQPKVKQVPLWQAPQVAEIACGVIERNHTHLHPVPMRFAFQQKMPRLFGRAVPARAEVVGGKAAALAAGLPDSQIPQEADAQFHLVIFGWGWWSAASSSARQAAVDEVLCRCGVNDKGGLLLWAPDVVTFRAVIERHGFYSHDLAELRKTVQGALDLEAPQAPAEPSAPTPDPADVAAVGPEIAAELAAEQQALDAEPSQIPPPPDDAGEEPYRGRSRRARGLSGEGEAALAAAV